MQVVAHDRIGVDANRKDFSELLDACFDDGLAVFEGFLGVTVDSAEPSAPYRSGNAVVSAALAGFDEIAARIGHGGDGEPT